MTTDSDTRLEALRALGATASRLGERAARLDPTLASLHQRIIRGFADGAPPSRRQLDSEAASLDLDVEHTLPALAGDDLIQLDATGEIQVAYPFSRQPTTHRVTYRSGTSVYAMCAIDAMGIAAMLGTALDIDSTDPTSGDPIRVQMRWNGGAEAWTPGEAVVVAGSTGTDGTTAQICCRHVHFFASPAHAKRYLRAHPSLAAVVVDIPTGAEIGRRIFGALL